MSTEHSKPKKAFFRKLYIAHLIAAGQHNLLSLNKETAMPRRTIQTAMEGFSDISIEYEFVQDGERNRHGYYRILNWGAIDPRWVESNLKMIIDVLQ